jgi:hypothetical protein
MSRGILIEHYTQIITMNGDLAEVQGSGNGRNPIALGWIIALQ